MSYEIYKVLHLLGLMCLFLGLGGLLFSFAFGIEIPKSLRSLAFALHGTGLLLMVISGFGLIARLALPGGFPGWAMAKLGIWLLMGAAAPLIKRKNQWTLPLVLGFLFLGGMAASLAITKPF